MACVESDTGVLLREDHRETRKRSQGVYPSPILIPSAVGRSRTDLVCDRKLRTDLTDARRDPDASVMRLASGTRRTRRLTRYTPESASPVPRSSVVPNCSPRTTAPSALAMGGDT